MKYRTWSLSCEIIDDSGLVLDETNEALCLDSDTYTPCVSNEIWVTPGFFKLFFDGDLVATKYVRRKSDTAVHELLFTGMRHSRLLERRLAIDQHGSEGIIEEALFAYKHNRDGFTMDGYKREYLAHLRTVPRSNKGDSTGIERNSRLRVLTGMQRGA